MKEKLFAGQRAQRFWGSTPGQLTFAGSVFAGAAGLTTVIWLIIHAL